MVIELMANLPDIPGTLVRMLKPISDNGGNIYSVIHSHGAKHGEKIPVIVQFDFVAEAMEEKIKIITKELKNLSIEIVKITESYKQETIIAILIGHVFETDFVDTYRRLGDVGAKIVRIEAIFTDIKDMSNVKFQIKCDEERINATIEELQAICQEKNLSLILDR